MIWNEKTNKYALASGRQVYANNGIFGLDGMDGVLYHGYDGHVDDEDEDAYHKGGRLTPDERQEIADEMIVRWQLWAKAAKEILG